MFYFPLAKLSYRMVFVIAWVGFVFLPELCVPTSFAQDVESDPLQEKGKADASAQAPVEKSRVDAILKQLEAASRAERDEAERQLIEWGAKVLEHLPEATPSMAAETVQRLARIRQVLAESEAKGSIAASLVSLSLTDAPVSQVFAELAKQSGNQIVDYRGEFEQDAPDPKVSITLENTPFWKAMDATLDAAGLELYDFPSDRGMLAYVAKQQGAPPRSELAYYVGPFRIAPLRFESVRSFRTATGGGLKFSFQLAWEPRISPIAASIPYNQLSITDENGNALATTRMEGVDALDVSIQPETPQTEMELPFDLPPRDVKKIGKLKGTLVTSILGEMREFDFDDVQNSRNVVKKDGGAQVTLRMARRPAEQVLQVFLDLQLSEAGEAMESYQGWIYSNVATLTGADGEKYEAGGIEETGRTENGVSLSYLFEVPKDQKYRLNYKTPVSVSRITTEFEMADLPLP